MSLRNTVMSAIATVALLIAATTSAQDRVKPFVLGSTPVAQSVELAGETATESLREGGFEVIGEYSPYDDALVYIVTNEALRKVAAATELGAFGAALRVAITKVDDTLQLSYVNPEYMALAYRLDGDITPVTKGLAAALGAEQTFGSKKGLTPKSLARYRYMFTTERFDELYELGEFDNQAQAVAAVRSGLNDNFQGLSPVYQLGLPEQNAVLIGVAMAPEGDDSKYYNDAFQMSVVDIDELRSTAYLPYEILVKDGKVMALHMRFRMAVHFPDLSMMGKHSFMTLMPSPGAIEDALRSVVAAVE